jgi:hypothetical protein
MAIADQFFGLMPTVRDNADSLNDDEIEPARALQRFEQAWPDASNLASCPA